MLSYIVTEVLYHDHDDPIDCDVQQTNWSNSIFLPQYFFLTTADLVTWFRSFIRFIIVCLKMWLCPAPGKLEQGGQAAANQGVTIQ